MNLTRSQLVIVGTVGAAILVLILVFVGILPGLKKEQNSAREAAVDLEFWGVFDEFSAYGGGLESLKEIYPNVTVRYRGFDNPQAYEDTLLDALAAGKGPDVFMIRNNSLPKNVNKIVPVPPTKLSLLQFRNLFPQVVEADFAPQGDIYALPLSLDTLALIYNQDFFDEAAITAPPITWEEFETIVPKLVRLDSEEAIRRAAAAIGGSHKTINQAHDILSLLMLQTGTKMVGDDFGSAEFASEEGRSALDFYTKFADSESPLYTWNDSLQRSLDAFSEESVVIIFDYAFVIPEIESKNPFINLAVSAIPQPESAEKSIAYPNYWGYVVSRQSRYQNLPWDFIIALTTNSVSARGYLQATEKPPALRVLIDEYLTDPDLNVFAKQALTARSWPQIDPVAIGQIFSQAIESVVGGSASKDVLRQAEEKVTRLMQRRL